MVTQQTAIPARFLNGTDVAEPDTNIHPDDAPTVALFFALDTQWRRHPFTGQRVGVDYSAIRPTAELAGIDISPSTLPALRVMEQAALEALAQSVR